MTRPQAGKTAETKAHEAKSHTAKAHTASEVENPKTDPQGGSNRIKDPKDWTTGHEPMTGAQASYLKTLAEETHDADAYAPDLDKAEASTRIDALRKEAGHER